MWIAHLVVNLALPQRVTHNAVAADFFGTGRPGIAAVSFLPADKFPDRIPRQADAVILFEQVSPGKFERHSLAKLDCDAVVCAAGTVLSGASFTGVTVKVWVLGVVSKLPAESCTLKVNEA